MAKILYIWSCQKLLVTLLYLKWITNKDLLYSTWNSAQCYAAAWIGGWFGQNDTCICKAESLCCSPETITALLTAIPQHKVKKYKRKQNKTLVMDQMCSWISRTFWCGPNILWMFWKRWNVLWDIIKLVSLCSSYLGIDATFLSVLFCAVHSFPPTFSRQKCNLYSKKFLMCHVINREVPSFLKLD